MPRGIVDGDAAFRAFGRPGALRITGGQHRLIRIDLGRGLGVGHHGVDLPRHPFQVDQSRRIDYTRELAREFRVDGIIGERLIFCDQWVVEHYMTGIDLKEDGIPFLQLDREYILSGKGQLRTRVQAFLETIEGARS